MFKQVFDYNGNPYILRVDENNEVLDSEKEKYKLYKFTDIAPPSNLYPPRTFDGDKWYGATAEEFENNNKPPEIVPSKIELSLAQAQMQVTKTANQLVKSQKEQAENLKELTKKEKRIQQLEEQQAQTMLEIAKLKGE